jgi:hypothetical protein
MFHKENFCIVSLFCEEARGAQIQTNPNKNRKPQKTEYFWNEEALSLSQFYEAKLVFLSLDQM